MRRVGILSVVLSYILPLRASTPRAELTTYLEWLARHAEVIVVDGSDSCHRRCASSGSSAFEVLMTSWPRPGRLFAALAVVPAVALGGLRAALVLAFAGLVTAEAGTRRAEGQRVFPPFTTMFTPVRIAERAVSAWLALGSQIVFKGIRSRGLVLPRAATPWRELHKKVRAAIG